MWTDRQKIYPLYRTSSPIGAAALLSPMKTKEKVEQGKGTADHLMPLAYLFHFKVDRSSIKGMKSYRQKFHVHLQHKFIYC